MTLFIFIKKELLLLTRDWHALALLFLMPTLFILIMSLAMQDTFSEQSQINIRYLIVNQDSGNEGALIATQLAQSNNFEQVNAQQSSDTAPTGNNAQFDQFRERVKKDDVQFLVIIPEDYSDSLLSVLSEPEPIELVVAPATSKPMSLLFETRLRVLSAQRYLNASSGTGNNSDSSVSEANNTASGSPAFDLNALNSVNVVSAKQNNHKLPTSVQQNVPAWLIFSMFFIAIPVSTTLLAEREHGTLSRMASMGVSRSLLLSSKLITYMLVNLIQVVLMFSVGIWLVPKLGGDPLTLGSSFSGLLLIAVATSYAAVALALLIANIANTNEHATVMAGACNIILAAIGGVMVPQFVMPPAMQTLSQFSPHSWGLQGFLDIILRDGGFTSVLFEAGLLVGFGSALLILSALLLTHRHRF